MLNLYITSTIRGEGKTFVTAGIAATLQSLGYRTSVYKPFQTGGIVKNGFTQSPDLTYIKTIDPYINTDFSYIFKSDSEPLIASENENNPISLDQILNDYGKISENYDCTIVDGDSGILSPIAPSLNNADIIKKLQIPLLFVISPSKNSVNNTLLSILATEEKGLKINGVVVNNIKENENQADVTSLIRIIEEYTDAKVLGLIPNLGKSVQPQDLITGILNGIDIESIFNVKIEKLGFGS